MVFEDQFLKIVNQFSLSNDMFTHYLISAQIINQ
jgi:hypothetical protein